MLRFELLLCRTLGRTLGELREQMSYTELLLWLEEYRRRPWGEDIEDLRAGIIASTVANVSGNLRHATSPADFVPRFEPQKEQSDEEIERILDAAFGAMPRGQ